MKRTAILTGIWVAGLLVLSMATALVVQRRALSRMEQANGKLQRQVEELIAQAEHSAAEREQLSTLLAASATNAGVSLVPEASRELLRLRGEVGRLRLQDRELEQSRREQMQVAQSKLANAKLELSRLTTLHAENLVSATELSRARFAVELLEVEAKGDLAEAAQIRLRHAEAELARATELFSQSLISQTEYEQALRKVESTRAGTR